MCDIFPQMIRPSPGLLSPGLRDGWIRLRTLIVLRWLAACGQLAAILVAEFYLDMNLHLGLCLMAVGAAVVANLIAIFVYPENRRLNDSEAMLALLFDILQLSFLLYLTGGLNNPFALMILAPVTISATALSLRSTVLLGLTAILLVTTLFFYHQPMRTDFGFVLQQSDIFRQGFWLAIVIGIAFESVFAWRVTTEIQSMGEALQATQMALAREQKLTDLGGVVAAAAHELGTPLATITLVSSELAEELEGQPDLQEDAALIRSQADRCRDILRSMGRAGKDDKHMRHALLEAVVREAAEPHANRGKVLIYSFDHADPPMIARAPEVIHGLRNLVQNAVDFAATTVWVDVQWQDRIVVRISDDGPGYPPHLLGRIGDPFLRQRKADTARPGYEGMGLGLFIAKTLLERSRAELSFANGSDPFVQERATRSGAIVEVSWKLSDLIVPPEQVKGPLGENTRLA
jgi:two-component system sensor histidine kinase RegB